MKRTIKFPTNTQVKQAHAKVCKAYYKTFQALAKLEKPKQ